MDNIHWLEGINGDLQVIHGGSVHDIMRAYSQLIENRINRAVALNNPRSEGNGNNGCVEKTSNGWRVRSTAGVPWFITFNGRVSIVVQVSSGIGNLRGEVQPGNSIKWNLFECDKPDRYVTIQPPANIHVDSLHCDYKDGVFKVWQTGYGV